MTGNDYTSFDTTSHQHHGTSSTTITMSTQVGTTSTSNTTQQHHHNKTILQSLYDLIQNNYISDLISLSDDVTSIPLLRREDVNSFVDGMMEMDDSGPNARDVSNAFVGPDSVLNSFGA